MGRALRYLLDTHAILWWWINSPRLSAAMSRLIRDNRADVVVSAVCGWEIATKQRLKKLPELDQTVAEFLPYCADEGFDVLPISPAHALRGGSYPQSHGDPFDRVLAAQAELDGFVLVTKDEAFDDFPCMTRW